MTTTAQDLKKTRQDKVNALLNECGVFFAFSNEQFEQNKTPLAEGDKYVSMGAGGYIPKSNVSKYLEGSKLIEKEYKEAVKAEKSTIEATILHELCNYECFYTGDISDAAEALRGIATNKQIWAVYRKHNK